MVSKEEVKKHASPPRRDDDREGHYVFNLGENLTPRCECFLCLFWLLFLLNWLLVILTYTVIVWIWSVYNRVCIGGFFLLVGQGIYCKFLIKLSYYFAAYITTTRTFLLSRLLERKKRIEKKESLKLTQIISFWLLPPGVSYNAILLSISLVLYDVSIDLSV